MRKERKHFTPEEKVAILRRHLLDKVPVSELCEELGLRPTVFYRWQKEFFENGAAAFQSQERPHRLWRRNRNGLSSWRRRFRRRTRSWPSDALHHPLTGPLAAHVDVAIIRVPEVTVATTLELSVEFVEHEVGQQ